MVLPSSVGFTPRSESRIDFSMADIALMSNGAMMMTRASGAVNEASCCSGVGVP